MHAEERFPIVLNPALLPDSFSGQSSMHDCQIFDVDISHILQRAGRRRLGRAPATSAASLTPSSRCAVQPACSSPSPARHCASPRQHRRGGAEREMQRRLTSYQGFS
eukprot:525415-Pleurochrysis_carterae.AAC.2